VLLAGMSIFFKTDGAAKIVANDLKKALLVIAFNLKKNVVAKPVRKDANRYLLACSCYDKILNDFIGICLHGCKATKSY